MSQLLQTLHNFGLCSQTLCDLGHNVYCGELHPNRAAEEVGLTDEQFSEVERIILMDPEQVELCALEVGLTLQQLDQIKMQLWAAVG